MKCTMCGYIFNEENAKAACENCFMNKGCKLIKCPNCGFENPQTPGWIKKIKDKKDKK